MDQQERQQFIQENRQTIKNSNLNLITIFLAVIELAVVFFGPFVSVHLSQMDSSISIYKTLRAFIGLNNKYQWFGYLLLIAAIALPILIVIFTLLKSRTAKVIAFVISLVMALVLVVITLKWMFGTSSALKMVQQIFADTNKKASALVNVTMGIGISSYLLLLTSVITTVAAYFNLKNTPR